MRQHMRVKGQAVSIRGTLKNYDPALGTFVVLFDVAMAAPNGGENPVALVGFAPIEGSTTTVKDAVWGLVWEFIGAGQ